MNAIERAVEPYNNALNQNTPVGKELEDIRRGMNFAGTFYQDITRAIARVKEGEQTKEKQDPSTQDVLASILADMNGASRGTMGQVQGISEIQGNVDKNRVHSIEETEEAFRRRLERNQKNQHQQPDREDSGR